MKISALLILLLAAQTVRPDTLHVARAARPIQQDGLLAEWKITNATSPEHARWRGDAAATREGLSGYWIFPDAGGDTCLPWSMILTRNEGDTIANTTVHAYRIDHPWFSVFQPRQGMGEDLIIEWILPWEKVRIPGDSSYTVTVTALPRCGHTATTIVITGVYAPGEDLFGTVFRKIQPQLLIIVLLAAAYIIMRMRLRRRTSQKE